MDLTVTKLADPLKVIKLTLIKWVNELKSLIPQKISKYYQNLYLIDDGFDVDQLYEMSRNEIIKSYSEQDQEIHKYLSYPIEDRKYSETETFELEDESWIQT